MRTTTTHCPNGHEYTAETTCWVHSKARNYRYRRCRICSRAAARRRERAKRDGERRCPAGHLVTDAPLSATVALKFACRVCRAARDYAALRAELDLPPAEPVYAPGDGRPADTFLDWVVVHRVLHRRDPGRAVTDAEACEVAALLMAAAERAPILDRLARLLGYPLNRAREVLTRVAANPAAPVQAASESDTKAVA